MGEQSFRIIMEGGIRQGEDPDEVVKNLSRLFKADEKVIKKLLSGRPRTVRHSLDEEKARRYVRLIEKAGAVCRMENEQEETAAVAERAPEEEKNQQPSASAGPTCPHCDYRQVSEADLPIIDGECPKCGYIARKGDAVAAEPLPSDSEPEESKETATPVVVDLPGAGVPVRAVAPLEARVLAGFHTFCMFVLTYLFLLVLLVVLFAPRGFAARFLSVHLATTIEVGYPALLAVLSLIAVSAAIPLLNGGRSWGQRIVGIVLLDVSEERSGDLYSLVTIRTACAALISFIPGIAANWIGAKFGLITSGWGTMLTMIVMAALSWGACWLNVLAVSDARGVIDRSTGVVQISTKSLSPQVIVGALIPGFAALSLILFLKFAVPAIWSV